MHLSYSRCSAGGLKQGRWIRSQSDFELRSKGGDACSHQPLIICILIPYKRDMRQIDTQMAVLRIPAYRESGSCCGGM